MRVYNDAIVLPACYEIESDLDYKLQCAASKEVPKHYYFKKFVKRKISFVF